MSQDENLPGTDLPATMFLGTTTGLWPIEAFSNEGHARAWLRDPAPEGRRRRLWRVTLAYPIELELVVEREYLRDVARCSAHGRAACPSCSRNPASCATEDGGCSVYASTGMHWDTCPNRAR